MAALEGTTAVLGGEPCRVLEVDEDTGFALIHREHDEAEGSSEWVLASELKPAKGAKTKDEVRHQHHHPATTTATAAATTTTTTNGNKQQTTTEACQDGGGHGARRGRGGGES